jgi:hypothetical protein
VLDVSAQRDAPELKEFTTEVADVTEANTVRRIQNAESMLGTAAGVSPFIIHRSAFIISPADYRLPATK